MAELELRTDDTPDNARRAEHLGGRANEARRVEFLITDVLDVAEHPLWKDERNTPSQMGLTAWTPSCTVPAIIVATT